LCPERREAVVAKPRVQHRFPIEKRESDRWLLLLLMMRTKPLLGAIERYCTMVGWLNGDVDGSLRAMERTGKDIIETLSIELVLPTADEAAIGPPQYLLLPAPFPFLSFPFPSSPVCRTCLANEVLRVHEVRLIDMTSRIMTYLRA
jgi:hypothetical protein